MNLCTCSKHIVTIFSFSKKSCLFIGFKTCEKTKHLLFTTKWEGEWVYSWLYSTLNKITQFWLVESSTINPKLLYSVGVPIKFPWKRRERKKIADSRFTTLMASFLPNKELFTNFVRFNHAWKHEEDSWNYFQCHTKPNLQVATILRDFDDYAIM